MCLDAKRILTGAALVLSVTMTRAEDAAAPCPSDYLEEIRTRFTPGKPTVVMDYSVRYRFLALNLMRVAKATVETTEGFWRAPGDTNEVPCCVINILLQSHSAADGGERGGRVYINDRIVSVVTMPELDTLYYLKMTDEFLNPIVGARKDIKNFHVYDLSGEALKFYAADLLAGTTATNIAGATDMAAQGKEVARVLSLLSDVYHGRCDPITPDSDFRIFVNCDSKAVPFAAQSCRADIEAYGGAYDALRVDVMPASEAPTDIQTRDFTVWTSSFMDVADRLQDPELSKIAAETPAWGMTPLIADYGLAIGSMRCSLVSMGTRDNTTSWLAVIVPAKSEPRMSL